MAMDDREMVRGGDGRSRPGGEHQLLRRLYSEDQERGAQRLSDDGPTMGAEANHTERM
jgi:hypothetical protein